MPPDKRILNAQKRSEVYKKEKRDKAQNKLKRRMETRKVERDGKAGKAVQAERLAKNVPRTLENTRQFDNSSYLTADPDSLASIQARYALQPAVPASKSEEEDSEDESDESSGSGDEGNEDEDMDDDDEPEAGPSDLSKAKSRKSEKIPSNLIPTAPGDPDIDTDEPETKPTLPLPPASDTAPSIPRILLTTSPSPHSSTHTFLHELSGVFPGSEIYKRLKGRGYELGRVARWAGKRGFGAMVVVNEDHRKASECIECTPSSWALLRRIQYGVPDRAHAITIINLPVGPTAYFKLTSIALGAQIAGHARASPHSPELILNNFSTLLGLSIGRLFGSMFPPQPMFRGRQVVTLHNQRDFMFFRRHRYVFDSPEKARLQEIGPRFTLKLRWLRKGLPSVTTADGIPPGGGDKEIDDVEGDDAEEAPADEEDMPEIQRAEGDVEMRAAEEGEDSEDEAAGVKSKSSGKPKKQKDVAPDGTPIPALDAQPDYEWKWKPKMEVSRRTFFL